MYGTKKNNELYHYGVIGQKWGVRRYQPYSTVPRGSGKGGKEIGEAKKRIDEATKSNKSTARNLNYLEKQYAKNLIGYNENKNKAQLTRSAKRYEKYRAKGEAYLKNIKDITDIQYDIIKTANKKGQDPYVASKERTVVIRGKDIAVGLLTGAFGMTVLPYKRVEVNNWKSQDKGR